MTKLVYWNDKVWINPDYIISIERRGSKIVLDIYEALSGRVLNCLSEEHAKTVMNRILNDINKTPESDELKREIETLRNEVHYRPDAPGYDETKSHFEDLVQ